MAVFHVDFAELGEHGTRRLEIVAGEIGLAQLHRIEGNVVAARAVHNLLGTDQMSIQLDQAALDRLLKGKSASNKEIRSAVFEYIDRRLEELPDPPPTLIEILCTLHYAPKSIVMSLNNLQASKRLSLGTADDPHFPASFDELLSPVEYEPAFHKLHSTVRVFPGAEEWIRREAKAFRKRAVDQHVIDGPLRAFISYSTKDKHLAGQIYKVLKGTGIKPFLAHENIDGSEEWMAKILGELEQCHIFVALLTENYRNSKWADHEAGYADARGKRLFPLTVEGDPHGFLGRIQGIQLDPDNVEPACEKIIKVIRDDEKLGPMLNKSEPKQVT